jgi:sugar transferase (PEP-CTERM system associated)
MIRILNRYISLKQIVFFHLEFVWLLLAGYVALALRFDFDPAELHRFSELFGRLLLISVVCQLAIAYNGLYHRNATYAAGALLLRLYQAFLIAWGILLVAFFLMPELAIGRRFFLLHLTLVPILLALGRLGTKELMDQPGLREKLLILGSGPIAKRVGRELVDKHRSGFDVVGFIDEDPAKIGERVVNPKVVGTPGQIPSIVETNQIRKVVIAMNDRRGRLPLGPLLACKVRGVEIVDGTSFYEALTGKILVEGLHPSWLIFSDGFSRHRVAQGLKRLIDLACATIGLILTVPLLLIIPIWIKLDSPGPVFYRQERVGYKGTLFTLIKFRSMRADAESGSGPIWATDEDPRITRAGRLLRKLRLDELPQLLNVLSGEMSFVGPRPERPVFVNLLKSKIPYYDLRHSVRPGITGWAQIKYRYGASIEDAIEKLTYDLYYIKNLSLVLDLGVIAETLKVVLGSRGAR